MTDDLVRRLREDQPVTQDMVSTMQCALQDAAADRIETLEAEVTRLRNLLRPFANIGVGSDPDYQPIIRMDREAIMRARAELNKENPDG